MAVKRNYGAFSKACERYFAPLASPLGFEPAGGAAFVRARDGYADGVLFEPSPWGSGEFCMTVGFHVPALATVLGEEPTFALTLGQRVPSLDHEDWLGAQDKDELLASLQRFADALQAHRPHFDRIHNVADIAAAHALQEGFGDAPPAEVSHLEQLGVANQGLLLVLADKPQEGARWIDASVASMKAGGGDAYTAPRIAALEGCLHRIRAGTR